MLYEWILGFGMLIVLLLTAMQRYTLYILLSGLLIGSNLLFAKPKHNIPDSLQVFRFEVDSIPFSMQRVEGGVFIMGGTHEQHREPISTDLPTHTVALSLRTRKCSK